MARKKIYDILPPKMAHKVENTLAVLEGAPKQKNYRRSTAKKSALKMPSGEKNKPSRFPLQELFIGGAILLVIAGIFLWIKLPKATVLIWPVTQTITLGDKVTLDANKAGMDTLASIMPARALEEEKELSDEFPATGSLSTDAKATGTISIYNSISPITPLTLIKGTHFLSNSGKYFVTLEKTTIPAAKYQRGKLVAGSVNVKVQAKESGSDSNIGPSKFSIPKLSGTAYYYTISAESTASMQGGTEGEVKKVTKIDLDNAKETLLKKTAEQAASSVRARLLENEVLLEDSLKTTLISSSASAKQDAIEKTFTVTVKVKVSGLAFSLNELRLYVTNKLDSQLPSYQNLLSQSLELDYSSYSSDTEKGRAIINVRALAKAYEAVNTNDLENFLGGKSASEIKEVIGQMYQDNFSRLEVALWPFWVNKAPKNKDKIHIELQFE